MERDPSTGPHTRWFEVLDRYVKGSSVEQAEAYLVLRRLVRNSLGHRISQLGSDAEDFIHDRLIEIAHEFCAGKISWEATFPGLVKISVCRKFIDWMRRRRRTVLVNAEPRQDSEEGVADLETSHALHHALQTLPSDQKAVVCALVIERRTLEETSASLGLSIGEIRGRLLKGLRTLRPYFT